MRDKTLCKDIRKLSTQYQTSGIEPLRASIDLLSTLPQRCMPFPIMACVHGKNANSKPELVCVWGVTNECFVCIPIMCEHVCYLKELYHDK